MNRRAALKLMGSMVFWPYNEQIDLCDFVHRYVKEKAEEYSLFWLNHKKLADDVIEVIIAEKTVKRVLNELDNFIFCIAKQKIKTDYL
jgi:hypothetical protein